MSMISLQRSTVLAAHRIRIQPPAQLTLVRVGAIAYDASVQSIQKSLIALGYSVGPDGADGKLGPNTKAAIVKFKSEHGLPANSNIDAGLRAALASAAGGGGGAVLPPPSPASIYKSSSSSSSSSTGGNTMLLAAGAALVVGAVVWFLLKK